MITHSVKQTRDQKFTAEVKFGGDGEEELDKILKSWSRKYRRAFITYLLEKGCSDSQGKILEKNCGGVHFN